MKIQTIFTGTFISTTQQLLQRIGDRVTVDHAGYKCKSHSEYKKVRGLFMSQHQNIAIWAYESYISERKITYVGLKDPLVIHHKHGKTAIHYLEIQDQKPDNSQISGIDHIEILPKGMITIELLIEELRLFQYDVKLGGKEHHVTHDFEIPYLHDKNLVVKIPKEPLIEKIKRDEMK